MAVDMFLKLDGISGDSTDPNHKDEIEIESFSWGVSNSSRVGAGAGGGAGKVAFQDFHFTAPSSSATPKLLQACAAGQHIRSATLTVRKAGQSASEFLKYELTDVLVSGFSDACMTDAEPEDTFTLNFAKFVSSFSPTEPTGALANPAIGGWDLSAVKID
jgi:type VI secretion system secreted protein Hcp